MYEDTIRKVMTGTGVYRLLSFFYVKNVTQQKEGDKDVQDSARYALIRKGAAVYRRIAAALEKLKPVVYGKRFTVGSVTIDPIFAVRFVVPYGFNQKMCNYTEEAPYEVKVSRTVRSGGKGGK